MVKKRENVLSKQDANMLIAKIIAKRSKDPNTQVGAVIVSESNRILSIGYNGLPNGCSDDEFPWDREAESDYDTKYPYICHSELNAILNFRGDNNALIGSSLYVTLFPCHECVKAIIQSGIKHIFYEEDKYKDTIDNAESRRMLKAVGIECTKIKADTSILKELTEKQNDAYIRKTINDSEYCSKCGATLPVASVSTPVSFCYHCGAKFKK